jgi:hypothetical protein
MNAWWIETLVVVGIFCLPFAIILGQMLHLIIRAVMHWVTDGDWDTQA